MAPGQVLLVLELLWGPLLDWELVEGLFCCVSTGNGSAGLGEAPRGDKDSVLQSGCDSRSTLLLPGADIYLREARVTRRRAAVDGSDLDFLGGAWAYHHVTPSKDGMTPCPLLPGQCGWSEETPVNASYILLLLFAVRGALARLLEDCRSRSRQRGD